MEVDQSEQINGDAGVVSAAACHGVDEAVVVFVAGGAIAIDDQVFVRIDIREDSRYFVWAIGWCLRVLGWRWRSGICIEGQIFSNDLSMQFKAGWA